MSYYINKICPVCRNDKVELSELGTEICTQCRYVIPGPTYATNSTSSAERYCVNCHTKLQQNGSWWECPNCHYGHMDYIGDPPQMTDEEVKVSKKIFEGKMHIPCDNTWGVGVGKIKPTPHTLQIDTELIRLRHKEMELEFELEPDKLTNIDTIILNGYKYVKEK